VEQTEGFGSEHQIEHWDLHNGPLPVAASGSFISPGPIIGHGHNYDAIMTRIIEAFPGCVVQVACDRVRTLAAPQKEAVT
jgi:hypothetical protein